jgi:anti-sigma factor RsiW
VKRSTECERFEELLPLYIDGELSAEEAAGVTVHLTGCEECTQSLDTYRALESSLDAMPGILPDSLAVSSMVTEHLGLEKRRSVAAIFSRMSLVWTLAVATAALILLISRFDFVSALMSGQESFTESAASSLEYWTGTVSGAIADLFSQIEATLAGDPWVLVTAMIGFGLVIFTAGVVAALKTLR